MRQFGRRCSIPVTRGENEPDAALFQQASDFVAVASVHVDVEDRGVDPSKIEVSSLAAGDFIAPNTADPEPRRQAFRKLKGLFTVCKGMIPMKVISMGMSDDFEIAIEEGSTMVRLGRAIFT